MKLLPKAWMPYAKGWVSLIGALLISLSTAWTTAPGWVPVAAAVVTAAGVFLVPNRDVPTDDDEGDSA